jgi:hypothetical protein
MILLVSQALNSGLAFISDSQVLLGFHACKRVAILWLLNSWLYGDCLFLSGYPYGSFKSDIEPSVSVNMSFAALLFPYGLI